MFQLAVHATLDQRLRRSFKRRTGCAESSAIVTEIDRAKSRVTCPDTKRTVEYDTTSHRVRAIRDSSEVTAN